MFEKGQVRLIDPSLRVRVANILAVLDAASNALDLAGPGNRLHELKGDQEGVWSVTVSGNWRITRTPAALSARISWNRLA